MFDSALQSCILLSVEGLTTYPIMARPLRPLKISLAGRVAELLAVFRDTNEFVIAPNSVCTGQREMSGRVEG